jgi:hypothetical protein
MRTIKIGKTSPVKIHYWWRHSEIVTNYRTNAVRSLHDEYLGGFAMRTVKTALLIVIFFTLEYNSRINFLEEHVKID